MRVQASGKRELGGAGGFRVSGECWWRRASRRGTQRKRWDYRCHIGVCFNFGGQFRIVWCPLHRWCHVWSILLKLSIHLHPFSLPIYFFSLSFSSDWPDAKWQQFSLNTKPRSHVILTPQVFWLTLPTTGLDSHQPLWQGVTEAPEVSGMKRVGGWKRFLFLISQFGRFNVDLPVFTSLSFLSS